MTTEAGVGRIHIDLGEVASEAAIPAGANLVTRPTGRAVRGAIETRLAAARRASVAVVDFSRVSVLDFSCADEVVAKLLLRHSGSQASGEGYFLFRVLDEVRGQAVAAVLARRSLAAVCDVCGRRFRLLGAVSPEEQAVWTVVEGRGRIPAGNVARVLGERGDQVLRVLASRRLVHRGRNGAATALSALIAESGPAKRAPAQRRSLQGPGPGAPGRRPAC